MSKRKERQAAAHQDYTDNRSPKARWSNRHRNACVVCSQGSLCKLMSATKAKGYL